MARERRQRDRNYTGILRSGRGRSEEREINQIEGRSRKFSWRIVSGLIVLALSGVLVLFFYSDIFYVHSIAVGGTRYMTVEEVFTYTKIADKHIFWVQPDEIRQNLINSAETVADVQVRVSWPPNMVSIIIEEREPALVWEQNGVAVWIDIQGNIMRQYEDRPSLLTVVADDPLIEGPLTGDLLDEDIIYGVLQLQELLPEVEVWRYGTTHGLGFRNANGWDVWLGVGANMAEKLEIYETLTSDIIARGIQPGEVYIVNPDAPFYTVLWGR
ncbi:MAG: FtsQ-type POTRA domain-containing protein [Anaerolineae bacterium]|nr:FtsQ-type POTRA domain-containing protein [Anaerolineae bacterium]